MAVTLRDIADEAGVSVMTVSNVVNGKSARVSQATIDRVTGIMQRRGYVPNAPARSLAAQRSHVIGVLVPADEGDSLLMSPHHTAVIGGVERQLRRHGYHVLLRGIADTAEVGEAVRGWSLDGVILLGFLDEEVDGIAIDGVPVVAVDSYSANPGTTGVRSDDAAGGFAAGRYLLERGHRAIAFAGPHFTDVGVVRRRFDGFRAALDEAGLAFDERRILESPTTYADGRRLAATLRDEHPDVTAVFATADILAIGMLAGLADAGVRVPDDVSVIGFDDLDFGGFVSPGLTTIGQDLAAKAAETTRILLAEIERDERPSEAVTLGIRVVERGSVAAPREPAG